MTRHADPDDNAAEREAIERGDQPPPCRRHVDPWVRPGSQVTAETIRQAIERLKRGERA